MQVKLNERRLRVYVQAFFVIFSIYIWYRLYLFVRHFDTGGATPYVPRPESVDAFMPVGALVAFKHLVVNRAIDVTHPAALVIFLAVLTVSLLFRRGFCGWICPVGALSEVVGKVGARLFGRNFRLPPAVDVPLRLIKYLILLFFLKLVLIDMPPQAVAAFLQSPYYKVVDAKLLDFWIYPGRNTIIFVSALLLLSMVIRNFWCRYLCPYGALLGILGFIGLTGVRRDVEKCNNCKLCTRVCHSSIKVHEKQVVRNPECNACFTCVDTCPKGALSMSVAGFLPLRRTTYAALLLGTFFLFVIVAKLTGHWNSGISYQEYAYYIPLRSMISH
jgi:polyferredoxin